MLCWSEAFGMVVVTSKSAYQNPREDNSKGHMSRAAFMTFSPKVCNWWFRPVSFELWNGNLSIKNPQEFWQQSTDVSPNSNVVICHFSPSIQSRYCFIYLISSYLSNFLLKKGSGSLAIVLSGTNCLYFYISSRALCIQSTRTCISQKRFLHGFYRRAIS